MLDVLNIQLIERGDEPVSFEHDCREGICGTCSMTINGRPHGIKALTTACQLHMRTFKDGDTIYVEPFRARAFPVIKDLVTDRSAFDRIQRAGGFVSVPTGSAPEANSIPIDKDHADEAFDAAFDAAFAAAFFTPFIIFLLIELDRLLLLLLCLLLAIIYIVKQKN
jgi:succinate dehydrogenase / fumarate reductase iron-sulfur subunit